MTAALAGRVVVITRPAHQAHHFQALVKQAGADVALCPTIEIQALTNKQADLTCLAALPHYQIVIFISANAVQFAHEMFNDQQRQQVRQLCLGAIGKKTAEALIACGYHVTLVTQSGFTSEDFLQLAALQQLEQQRILIVRGQGGRELLAQRLSERGASVDYLDVYQRVKPKPLNWQQLHYLKTHAQRLIISFTSAESVHNFLALTNNGLDLSKLTLLVGGQRIAQTARMVGFSGTLIVADDPSDESMFKALVSAQSGVAK
jgi:uroporphyrinogen-III synthase